MIDSYSYPADQFILIGRVAKAHGLKGEVKFHPFSGEADNINQYRRLVLVNKTGRKSLPLDIKKSRVAGKAAIIHIDGIESREKAEEIYGMGVLIYKEDLPNLDKNEFYYHDLIGLPVQTTDGTLLGKVIRIFSNGAQEVMEIRKSGHHHLIPVVQDIVIHHDEEKIIIAPPPGLLDL